MITKAILPGAVLLLFAAAPTFAQPTPFPTLPSSMPAPAPPPPTAAEGLTAGTPIPNAQPAPVPNPLGDAGIQPRLPMADGLTAPHWLGGSGPGCCGPLGRNGPISEEIYLRTGPSLPVAGGFLMNRAQVGWQVEAGGRSLFFNPAQDGAWALDLGLGYIYNNGVADQLPHNQEGNLITLRNLHRAYVSVALGHEWYMFGNATHPEPGVRNMRYGADIGGRFGTSHIDANLFGGAPPFDYLRIHDVYGGMFLALHTDLEFPVGAWTAVFGLRTEWAYSWIDYVTNDTNSLHDVNILMTFGIRF